MSADVSVVVATFQRSDRLPRLVAALESQSLDRRRFEVVVIDNGTTDDTADVLAALAASSPLSLRTIRLEENRGPVPARNAGWRSTATPWVAFTDDDCAPEPGWLAGGLAVTDDDDVGIVQGRTVPASPPRIWSATRRVEQLSLLFEGCNLFVRRDALEASNGFDDRFHFFGEDTSMGWTILEAGYEARFAPDAVVRHDVTPIRFRDRLRQRAMEGNLVRVARFHPRFRQEACWRPWAYRSEDVYFVIASVAVVAAGARRQPLLALATLPWLRARWPGDLSRAAAVHLVQRAVDDAVGVGALLRASMRERTLLL